VTKKIHILTEKIAEEFVALGIASSNSIFQLMMDINNFTEFNFKITLPASNPKKTEKYSFPHSSCSPGEYLYMHIFKNKHNGQILFGHLHAFDYIVVCKGENVSDTSRLLKDSLKKLENISIITKIELKSLKNIKEILKTVE
jgi:hypothetical protein